MVEPPADAASQVKVGSIMNICAQLLVVSGCLAAISHSAWGGIVTPISSNRLVSALNRETLPQTQVTFTGPSSGPWSATAYANNNLGQPNYNVAGNPVAVTSSQTSSFDGSGASYSGAVFIDYSAVAIPNLGVAGSNRFDASFHVEGLCEYGLLLTLSGNDFFGETTGRVVLRNDSTAQTLLSLTTSSTRSGSLPTGDYTLSVTIEGSTSGPNQFADARRQFDLMFVIPSPATTAIGGIGLATMARRNRQCHAGQSPFPVLSANRP